MQLSVLERPLRVRLVVGSIRHGEQRRKSTDELLLVPAGDPQLV